MGLLLRGGGGGEIAGFIGSIRPTLLFLFTLAWKCRKRLPVILTVGFLILDVRMRLEINVIGPDGEQNDEEVDSDDDDDEEEEDGDEGEDDEYEDFDEEELYLLH